MLNRPNKGLDATTFFIVVYFFWIFTTPQFSSKLAFLATIQFEKILAGILIVIAICHGKLSRLFDIIVLLNLSLFCFMVASNTINAERGILASAGWSETYWKRIVFFLIISVAIQRPEQLNRILIGSSGLCFSINVIRGLISREVVATCGSRG